MIVGVGGIPKGNRYMICPPSACWRHVSPAGGEAGCKGCVRCASQHASAPRVIPKGSRRPTSRSGGVRDSRRKTKIITGIDIDTYSRGSPWDHPFCHSVVKLCGNGPGGISGGLGAPPTPVRAMFIGSPVRPLACQGQQVRRFGSILRLWP